MCRLMLMLEHGEAFNVVHIRAKVYKGRRKNAAYVKNV